MWIRNQNGKLLNTDHFIGIVKLKASEQKTVIYAQLSAGHTEDIYVFVSCKHNEDADYYMERLFKNLTALTCDICDDLL